MGFDLLSSLFGLLVGVTSFSLVYRRRPKAHRTDAPLADPRTGELLHWNPLIERRGLGELLTRLNHIAITVSDVGKSLGFYVDILGLQQIRRPSFDRHGAWLTMGNIELHLIKGIPALPPVDNLQVSHLAFETSNIAEVLNKLRQLNIDVRQSLSVTEAHRSIAAKGKSVITQYFFNDPDGYYIELCNCDVLTQFSLEFLPLVVEPIDYHEGVHHQRVFSIVQFVSHWRRKTRQHSEAEFDELLQRTVPASEADEKKLGNLIRRRSVYGDVTQGFNDHELRQALLQANNSVPLAIKVLVRKRGERIYFRPPSFIEHGELVDPEPFTMDPHQYE